MELVEIVAIKLVLLVIFFKMITKVIKIIKIMEQYNEQILDSYFKRNDLFGAADYLSKCKAKDARSQIELNNRITQLRKDAEIQKAYVSKLDQEGKDAFYFTNGLKNGNIPHTTYNYNGNTINNTANSYGDKYINIINNLKVNDDDERAGQRINTIRLEWANDELYNSFINNLNIKDINNNTLGLKHSINKDGVHLVDISVNNTNLAKVLKSANNVDDDYWLKVGAAAATGGAAGAGLGSVIPGLGTVIGSGIGGLVSGVAAAFGADHKAYTITGLGNGFTAPKGAFNSDTLDDLVVLVNEAEEIEKANKEKIQNDKTTEKIIVSQFLGAGHAKAFQARQANVITLDEYNKIVKEREETYNRLLSHVDLTQKKVYKSEQSDKGDFVMRLMDNNKERSDLMKILSVALHDNRVTYAAAIRGGEVGTYITIAADKDEKGNLSSGNAEQFIRIFVPDLFESSCNEVINSDTKIMAAQDNANMKRLQYGKRLHNGVYVGYDDEFKHYSITVDANGNETKQSISEDEMLQHLNREHIIDMSVNKIIFQLDNDDNEITIEDFCKLAANAGTNDLYPAGAYTENERIHQQQLLYNDIYDIIARLYGNNNKKEEK